MADRPMTELGTIDPTALERVVGGEVETGQGQWHMAVGTLVGLGAYLVDRYERKNIAAEAASMMKTLHNRIHLPHL